MELEELIDAISRVVAWIVASGHFVEAVPDYQACQESAKGLLRAGFDQAALHALSRAVPRLIELHQRWDPPLIEAADGRHATPPWFDELKPLHDRVVETSENLRAIGRWVEGE